MDTTKPLPLSRTLLPEAPLPWKVVSSISGKKQWILDADDQHICSLRKTGCAIIAKLIVDCVNIHTPPVKVIYDAKEMSEEANNA